MSTLLRVTPCICCAAVLVLSADHASGRPKSLERDREPKQAELDISATRLSDLYARRFETLDSPSADDIARRAEFRRIPPAPKRLVWDAVIVVMMQRGPVLSLSTETGILVAPPYAVQVSLGDEPKVAALVYSELFDRSDGLGAGLSDEKAKAMEIVVLEQIRAQISAYLSNTGTLRWPSLMD